MFAFLSAFPKSLHCTDEAQQAETDLSAVLSIYIYIYIYIKENWRAAGLEPTTSATGRTIVTDGDC